MYSILTFYKKIRLVLIFGICVIFSANSALGQLSGNYTINPAGAASSTNYKTFSAAVSDLDFGTRPDGGTANGPGVNGAVVFKISNGVYMEKISITDITGTSSSNTITFESASQDSTKVILQSTGPASTSNFYTLQLDGADYVTFKGITIKKLDTVAVYITNTATNNRFLNNIVIGQKGASTLTSGFQNIQSSAVAVMGASNDNNLFQQNNIIYGTNGIFFQTTGSGNKVINNIIDTPGSSGVYALSQTAFIMDGNTVNLGAFSSNSGHYVSYGIRIESSTFQIIRNRFYATSLASVSRCITVFNGATSSSGRNLIANNFAWVSAGSSSSTGITIGGCASCDIVYNNVLMTSTPSASAALYYYAGYSVSDNIIKNNNLINMGTGYAVDNSPTTITLSSNYNNLYTKGTYIGSYQGSKYTTLSAWQSGTSLDANSVSTDPGYVSNMNLHVSSAAINGKGNPVSGVTTDIDGDIRNTTTPDIGADEFTPLALDAGVTALDSPAVYCAGTKNVFARISNFGTSTLQSATVNWSVNGVAKTPVSWTGSVTIGNTSAPINLGPLALAVNTPYTIKIWTSAPNAGVDGQKTNDTLTKVINSALSGNYTIGGVSPDFKSFNDAIDGITLRGICSSTVFNVRNGVYSEQVIIPAFATSANKTITFQSESKDSSKVILTYASSTATGSSNAVLQLNGADYITIKQISLTRTGTNDIAPVLDIKSGATNNNILNNRIIGTKRTVNSANGDLVYSVNDLSTKDENNTFKNNYLKYGITGFNITGAANAHEKNNVIEGNIIDSTFGTGININNNDGVIIRRNILKNILATGSASNATYSGILIDSSDAAFKVLENKIYMPTGGMAAIQITNSTATQDIIANNYISIFSMGSSTTPIGILSTSNDYLGIYFNSIDISNANAGTAIYLDGSDSVKMANNILFNRGGGLAIVAESSSLSSSNYNDIYTTGNVLGRFGTSNIANIAAWRTATSKDANSISVNPFFVSNTSYQTINPFLYRKGIAVTGITTDIDGNTRFSTPNIGALEFKRSNDEASLSDILSPQPISCTGNHDVIFNITNTGGNALTSLDINWILNGVLQPAFAFTGNIAPDATQAVVVGNHNFMFGQNNVKAYISSPNGKNDPFTPNDTLYRSSFTFTAIANAGTDRELCKGDSINIGAPGLNGETYSWRSIPAGFTSTNAYPKVSPAADITYILEVTTANNCKDTDSVKIKVNNKPIANAGPDKIICAGELVTIGTTAVSGQNYSWRSIPAGYSTDTANPTLKPMATATYILEVRNASNCMVADSVKITVNPRPVSNAGTDKAICSGASAVIGVAPVSGLTYTWSSIPAGFSSTNSTETVSPTVTTTYILDANDGNSCSAIDSVTVKVNALPVANAGVDRPICTGGSYTLGSPMVAGHTYSWTSTPAGFTSPAAQPTVSPTATTTYHLLVTGPGGCTKTDEITITVNPLPVANAGRDTAICTGASVKLGNPSLPGHTYEWSAAGGFSSFDAQPTVSPTANTNYTLVVTNNNGCVSTDAVMVTVNAIPLANAGRDTAVCAGSDVKIGTPSITGNTYSWTAPGGYTSKEAQPTVTAMQTTVYTVTVTGAGGCTKTDNVTVTVSPSPATAAFNILNTSGRSYVFSAVDKSQSTYVWDFGDGNSGSGATTTHAFAADGSFTVKLTVGNSFNCTVTRDSILKVGSVGIDGSLASKINLNIYPNPFKNITNLVYTLDKKAQVNIKLMDVTGKQISYIAQGNQPQGNYTVEIRSKDHNMKPGIYFVEIQIGESRTVRKIVNIE